MRREVLTFNAYQLNLSYQIWVGIIFVYQKSLKRTLKTGFWVQNHLSNSLARVDCLISFYCPYLLRDATEINIDLFIYINSLQFSKRYILLTHIFFCIPEVFKPTFKASFWVQNHFLNLCSSTVNSQRLLCSPKASMKCPY